MRLAYKIMTIIMYTYLILLGFILDLFFIQTYEKSLKHGEE